MSGLAWGWSALSVPIPLALRPWAAIHFDYIYLNWGDKFSIKI